MEPESLSPYPQVPATCPYPEPTPSSPHNPLQLPSFLQASPPTPCAHLYHPPYALHAMPISFVLILPPVQYWVRSTDIQFLVMQLSPFPCHLVPLRSKYFPQHPILQVQTTSHTVFCRIPPPGSPL